MGQINLFNHKTRTYAMIGNHTWQVLEGFKYGQEIVFAIVTGLSGTITQEYLPSGTWKVQRFKVRNKQPLFVIYNSTYFKHSDKFYGKKQAYVAKSTEGCLYLGIKDLLDRIGIEVTDANIANTVPLLRSEIKLLTSIVDNPTMEGRVFDYAFVSDEEDYTIKSIKEKLNGN
jgi:hypothetical protein